MPRTLRQLIALTCSTLLALQVFFLILIAVLRVRGEDPAWYTSASPSLAAILGLAILCWLLRNEFRSAQQRQRTSP